MVLERLADSVDGTFRLDGLVALVTGVGPGIGGHVAWAYGRAGAKVILCARTEERIEALANEMRSAGMDAVAVRADVAEKSERDRLAATAAQRFGGVDVLFNNAASSAGVGLDVDALSVTEDAWRRNVDVNLLAPYRLAQAVVPGMKKRDGGSIINVISTAGFVPVAGIGAIAYGATKAGLAMMTRYLAKECAPLVRANMICPGTIDPAGQMRGIWRDVLPSVPLRRVGAARELVGAALLLASSASSYMTGQVLFVDGGRVNTAS